MRPAAHLLGSIAAQLGSKGAEVSWVRIEMSKVETLPSGESWTELIGKGPVDVWRAQGEWQLMRSREFPFELPVPEKLPPSLRLDKHSGIRYQLIASMCVRVKRGFFRRQAVSTVVTASEPILLEKHELHSTWPIYNLPEEHEETKGNFRLKMFRNKTSFAVLDEVQVRMIVHNQSAAVAKVKSLSILLRQHITLHANSDQPMQQKTDVLATKNKNARKKIKPGELLMYDLSLVVPKSHTVMTISTAKHIDVAHALCVSADVGKTRIVIDQLPVQISGFSASVSEAITARIGHVPELSLEDETEEEPDPRHYVFSNDPGAIAESRTRATPPPESVLSSSAVPMFNDEIGGAEALGTPTPMRARVFQQDQVPDPAAVADTQGRDATLRNQFMGEPPERPQSVVEGGMRPGDLVSPMVPSPRGPQLGASASGAARRPDSSFAVYRDFTSAEHEKQRLFERARAEAQAFQSRYGDGASFAEESSQRSPPAVASPRVASPPVGAPSGFPSAATEKAALYQRAKEEVDAFQQSQAGPGAGGLGLAPPAQISEPPATAQAAAAAPPAGASSSAPAVDEKEQVRRYYEAQDSVARHLAQQNGSGSSQAAAGTAAETAAPAAADSAAPAPAPALTAESAPLLTRSEARAAEEKQRLNRHYADSAPAPPAQAGPPPAFEAAAGGELPPFESVAPHQPAPSAADEKAQMAAHYAKVDAQQADADAAPPVSPAAVQADLPHLAPALADGAPALAGAAAAQDAPAPPITGASNSIDAETLDPPPRPPKVPLSQ